jgi:hypothetical protein
LENDILGNAVGLQALEAALTRSTDTLVKEEEQKAAHHRPGFHRGPGPRQAGGVAYNGHFAKNCFHPLFCFTSEGDCLGAKLRPGNVHSADGALEFVKPIVERYRGGSSFSGFGATLPLPTRKSTIIARNSGSRTSFGYRQQNPDAPDWNLT